MRAFSRSASLRTAASICSISACVRDEKGFSSTAEPRRVERRAVASRSTMRRTDSSMPRSASASRRPTSSRAAGIEPPRAQIGLELRELLREARLAHGGAEPAREEALLQGAGHLREVDLKGGAAQQPRDLGRVALQRRARQRRERSVLQLPREHLEGVWVEGALFLEALQQALLDVLHQRRGATEVEVEELAEGRGVPLALDQRALQRGPHREAVAEPHQLQRPRRVGQLTGETRSPPCLKSAANSTSETSMSAPLQRDHRFDVVGLGEEVERGDLQGPPAEAEELADVPGQRGGVAGDVDQAAGHQPRQQLERVLGTGARRVEQPDVETGAGRFFPLQRVGGPEPLEADSRGELRGGRRLASSSAAPSSSTANTCSIRSASGKVKLPEPQ